MAHRPMALTRAAKKAEEAHKKAYPHLYATPPSAPDPNAPPGGEVIESVDLNGSVDPGETRGAFIDAPASFEDTPTEDVIEPSPSPSDAPPAPNYQELYEQEHQRLLTLQGKYRKEVPGMAFQIADLNRKIEEMRTKLENPPKSVEPVRPSRELILKSLETNPKTKTFKEEFPDVFEGVASVVSDIFDERDRRIESGFEKLKQESDLEADRRFWREMDRDFPQWRKLNKNPEFLAWLDDPEPYSGITKQELLERARQNHDSVKAIQFFKDYLKLKQSTSPPLPATPTKDDLSEQVGIPRGSRGTPPRTPQPTVTREDLRKFYEDVRRGKWKGREDEKGKEEQRLISALRRQQGK